MKKTQLFIGIILVLIFNACTTDTFKNSFTHETLSKKPIFLSENNGEGAGGNPEVYIAHQCLINKDSQTCLEKLFSDERKAYIQSYKTIKLAGRGRSVTKATITFKNDDLFLLYLDTSKVQTPLSINIKSTKTSTDTNSVLFLLPVQEIGEEIIIKDKENNIVLQYKILKNK